MGVERVTDSSHQSVSFSFKRTVVALRATVICVFLFFFFCFFFFGYWQFENENYYCAPNGPIKIALSIFIKKKKKKKSHCRTPSSKQRAKKDATIVNLTWKKIVGSAFYCC